MGSGKEEGRKYENENEEVEQEVRSLRAWGLGASRSRAGIGVAATWGKIGQPPRLYVG